jgi:hypothetical protein
MHPQEFWWYYESKLSPEQLLSPAEKWQELYDMLD